MRPLWRCPECGREFANKNQWHSCGKWTVEEHFEGKSPEVVSIYAKFVDKVKECGPVMVVPTKTRIGFQVRMTFADVMLRKQWLDGHVVLARRLESPRFTRIVSGSPRNHVHYFRFKSVEELDEEVGGWLREAYEVGEQKHLGR